jgi:WD40 repeat protein|eukprot:7378787-Prymnesium_polylepis.2
MFGELRYGSAPLALPVVAWPFFMAWHFFQHASPPGTIALSASQGTFAKAPSARIFCRTQVRCIRLSADGSLVACGDEERKARLWDIASGTVIFSATCGHTVFAIDLSEDCSTLASGDAMGKLKVTMAKWHAAPTERL